MTGQLPIEIESTAERIALPSPRESDIPIHVTGELRHLLAWWQAVGTGATPIPWTVPSDQTDGREAAEAMVLGIDAANGAVDRGCTLLVPRAVSRRDGAARSVIASLTRTDPSAVLPQPEGMPDRTWMAGVAQIRDDANRLSALRGESLRLLDAVAASGLAFVAGVLLGAAARQTACIVDGTDECAAALVADRISTRAKAWWICGTQSTDPARLAVVERVGLSPGLPLALTDETGFGAEATVALLQLLTTSPSTFPSSTAASRVSQRGAN